MAAYDSDSSMEDDDAGVSTNVLLGYATKETTDDSLSHLGGQPIWLKEDEPPSFALAQCKTCRGPMSLLLQLNGELPDRFPGHERQLYIWACRRKACRRKPGSIRAVRATRVTQVESKPLTKPPESEPKKLDAKPDLGSALFGGSSTSSASANPFAAGPFSSSSSNPFSNPFATTGSSTSGLAAKPSQKPAPDSDPAADLPATFAEKVRLSSPPSATPAAAAAPSPFVPWPTDPALLSVPYPAYHLDADYEYLSAAVASPAAPSAAHAALLDSTDGGAGAGSSPDETAYEDRHDRAFQRFADTVSQNPEQVLRYEYAGAALLFSRTDAVGAALAGPLGGGARTGMPPCEACGAGRVFEVQLCPRAIVELEEGGEGVGEGMEWGTVVVGVCERDCGGPGVAYREEWCGVQWEEVMERKRG